MPSLTHVIPVSHQSLSLWSGFWIYTVIMTWSRNSTWLWSPNIYSHTIILCLTIYTIYKWRGHNFPHRWPISSWVGGKMFICLTMPTHCFPPRQGTAVTNRQPADVTAIHTFKAFLNSNSLNLRFVVHFEPAGIAFLDLLLFVNDNKILTKSYRKDTAGNTILHSGSCHPSPVKGNIPYGEWSGPEGIVATR